MLYREMKLRTFLEIYDDHMLKNKNICYNKKMVFLPEMGTDVNTRLRSCTTSAKRNVYGYTKPPLHTAPKHLRESNSTRIEIREG